MYVEPFASQIPREPQLPPNSVATSWRRQLWIMPRVMWCRRDIFDPCVLRRRFRQDRLRSLRAGSADERHHPRR